MCIQPFRTTWAWVHGPPACIKISFLARFRSSKKDSMSLNSSFDMSTYWHKCPKNDSSVALFMKVILLEGSSYAGKWKMGLDKAYIITFVKTMTIILHLMKVLFAYIYFLAKIIFRIPILTIINTYYLLEKLR